MNQFHHHPDGLLYMRTDSGIYAATVEQFELDSGLPYEGLPDGIKERRYTQGHSHIVMTDADTQVGRDVPWEVGDRYLDLFSDCYAKQKSRETTSLLIHSD